MVWVWWRVDGGGWCGWCDGVMVSLVACGVCVYVYACAVMCAAARRVPCVLVRVCIAYVGGSAGARRRHHRHIAPRPILVHIWIKSSAVNQWQ